MAVPNNIALTEDLGRGVFSDTHAKRARRSRVPINIFLGQEGSTEISVDRLTLAPSDEATAIADTVASARNRTFYGWAVVTAEKAGGNGRWVKATPKPDQGNPYHADIILPGLAAQDREEHKRHAQELADIARWRERPTAF